MLKNYFKPYNRVAELHKALLKIKEMPNLEESGEGICSLVSRLVKEPNLYQKLTGKLGRSSCMGISHYFDYWEGFSGAYAYPVPHPDLKPKEAFYIVNKWTGQYGESRRRLLDFLIEATKQNKN